MGEKKCSADNHSVSVINNIETKVSTEWYQEKITELINIIKEKEEEIHYLTDELLHYRIKERECIAYIRKIKAHNKRLRNKLELAYLSME